MRGRDWEPSELLNQGKIRMGCLGCMNSFIRALTRQIYFTSRLLHKSWRALSLRSRSQYISLCLWKRYKKMPDARGGGTWVNSWLICVAGLWEPLLNSIKVTRPIFFGGYHLTLKLSGIPTFTFIVSVTHRMDNILINLQYNIQHSEVSQAWSLHACWTRMLYNDRLETIDNSQSTNSAKTLKILNVCSNLGL